MRKYIKTTGLLDKGGEDVSKKRRRYYREKKQAKQTNKARGWDNHHLFYQGRHYANGHLMMLRKHPYSIVAIPRDTLHRSIHEFVGDVPAPKPINAKSALKQLEILEGYGAIKPTDDIERRLKVYIALFNCIEPATAKALMEQLEVVRRFCGKPSE